MTHNELSAVILSDLLHDFVTQGLAADDLRRGYVGMPILTLQDKYCGSGLVTAVDFDLVMNDLEEEKALKTGPMVPYDNPPGSSVVVIALFSKREYAYLTEVGYKRAQKNKAPLKNNAPRPAVHISGGTFHHSPIGVGTNVRQSVNIDISNQTEAATHLLQLLSHDGRSLDDDTVQQVVRMVDVTEQGNLADAKPIFQKLFGTAAESVKNVAWGILTAVITRQMGLN